MTQRIDIRKMPPDGQAAVRKIIIRMKSNGNTIEEIIGVAGCSARHISYTWGRYIHARTKAQKEQAISTGGAAGKKERAGH